jgi:hypothetical protein
MVSATVCASSLCAYKKTATRVSNYENEKSRKHGPGVYDFTHVCTMLVIVVSDKFPSRATNNGLLSTMLSASCAQSASRSPPAAETTNLLAIQHIDHVHVSHSTNEGTSAIEDEVAYRRSVVRVRIHQSIDSHAHPLRLIAK